MTTKSLVYPFLLLLIAQSAHAARQAFSVSDQNGRRQIVFTSDAPTEVVEGTARTFSGSVTLDPQLPDLDLSALVRVEVNAMETGVALRDTHMKGADWLDAARYSNIQFSLGPEKPVVKSKGKDTWFVNAKGQFSLKGIARPVTVPLTLKLKSTSRGKELSISGRFDVTLQDHNITGPAAMKMIGVRVSPVVRVDLKLVATAPQNR